jgi:hypothetical protein
MDAGLKVLNLSMVQPRHLADKINENKLIYHLLTGRVICEQKLGNGIKVRKNPQVLCLAQNQVTA